MAEPKVVVVTGSNRGIGKGIVQLLARAQLPQPLIIYATSRSGAAGDLDVLAPNIVLYRKLDITDPQSIQSLFTLAEEEHGAIDILVNNAAVSNDHRETPDLATETIKTNFGGTRDMCKALLAQPNIRPGARIVNVTSGYNQVKTYGPDLQAAFHNARNPDALDVLASDYLDRVRRGSSSQEQGGWGYGARSYKVSKALINALTIVLSQQRPDVLVNSGCPGWTDTVMGNQAKGKPPKTPEEGARILTRLAVGDLGPGGDVDGSLGKESELVTGHFYENDNIVEPGWGKAKLWLES
ncbi:carbonyl reductase [Stagonosporopsis vannaccii]|nr:carbonyl reductase [Stagonosporopsis vannaccii]